MRAPPIRYRHGRECRDTARDPSLAGAPGDDPVLESIFTGVDEHRIHQHKFLIGLLFGDNAVYDTSPLRALLDQYITEASSRQSLPCRQPGGGQSGGPGPGGHGQLLGCTATSGSAGKPKAATAVAAPTLLQSPCGRRAMHGALTPGPVGSPTP